MKVITIIGARPQFIKSAPVSKAFLEFGIHEITIHTGQHYDANMSKVFFEEMGLPTPGYRLECGGLSRDEMLKKMGQELAPILKKESPDYVLVYGDTNSTLAGARAARDLNIPLVHVEAGLRSFNMDMPEEHNRVETDKLSQILFTPTKDAEDNLEKEGFLKRDIEIIGIGDVMYDALLAFKHKAAFKPSEAQTSVFQQDFGLVTVHRFENTSDEQRLRSLVEELNEVHENLLPLWMPLHPSTASKLRAFNIELKIYTAPPVGYLEMLWLLSKCSLVLTDSGGLQKEAYFSQKPCITLRDQTEWVELVNRGVNVLYKIGSGRLSDEVVHMHKSSLDFSWKGYGNGDAAQKIAQTLLSKQA